VNQRDERSELASKEGAESPSLEAPQVDTNPYFAYLLVWELRLMTVAERIAGLCERIESAKKRRGASEGPVHLLAAVKEREAFEIEEAVKAGIKFIGENKIQEGEKHFPALSAEARSKASCHFIGRLQSNKAKKAVKIFDSIDSVDSVSLALKLEKAAEELDLFRDVMVEVNMGEEQKGGIAASGLSELCDTIFKCPHITLTGLMGVPPYFDEPEKSRPYFNKLYKLFGDIRKVHPDPRVFSFLSMGMSGDFEAAIEEGSNMVRIGTFIFGPRRAKW
jgi:PLP dependent protein